ncbi:MAG: hypothetical protein ABIH38_00105 [Patescibacteria group bacterium]
MSPAIDKEASPELEKIERVENLKMQMQSVIEQKEDPSDLIANQREAGLNLATLKKEDLTPDQIKEFTDLAENFIEATKEKDPRLEEIAIDCITRLNEEKNTSSVSPNEKEPPKPDKTELVNKVRKQIDTVLENWDNPSQKFDLVITELKDIGLSLATLKKEDFKADEEIDKFADLVNEFRGVVDDEKLIKIANECQDRLKREN